jgi:hypothetical protein
MPTIDASYSTHADAYVYTVACGRIGSSKEPEVSSKQNLAGGHAND